MSVEDQYANSISIVYPAVLHMDEKVNIPIDPEINLHCTIQFFGEIDEVHFTRKDLENAIAQCEFPKKLTVPVDRIAHFGADGDFLVLLLDPTELAENQKIITDYLKQNNLVNPLYKGYADYKPHVTVRHGYTGSRENKFTAPSAVTLSHPVVWWGNQP